jgi:hypothetical protein
MIFAMRSVMIRVWLFALGMLWMGSGCATRLARPHIKGMVYDQRTHQPLQGVKVRTTEGVETATDTSGKFELAPRTYREFAFPGGEAPPVLLLFWLSKAGYLEQKVERIDRFGGGGSVQVPWVLERLELQPIP